MKNTHLVKCNVTTCKYYDSNCCTSMKIHVVGDNATSPSETVCDTFTTKSNIVTNMLSAMDNTGETKIDCKAVKCAYNNDCACTLDSIDVTSCCSSCDCNSAHETCCSSFKAR